MADLALENSAPGDEREVAAAFDDGKPAAYEVNWPPDNPFHPRSDRCLAERLANFRG